MRYRGNNHFCPLCGFYADKFLDSGNGERKNVRCPRCSSLERHRAQWLFGLEPTITSQKEPFTLLHFTPEFCIARKIQNMKKCDYCISEFPYKSYADYHIDITDIKLNNEAFDFIICNHVLEHIEDDFSGMRELNRILKKNGTAFIQVPIDMNSEKTYEDKSITTPGERQKAFLQHDHHRIYGRDYLARLERAGFEVNAIQFWNDLPPEKLSYYGITDLEPVFICRK